RIVHLERHIVADVVHLERRAVADRATAPVVAEMPLLLVALTWAEVTKRILHRPVVRRAGEPVTEAVGELHAHGHREALRTVALLRAVALVHHADDGVARQRREVAHVPEGLDG